MPNPKQNLETLLQDLRAHRAKHPPCADRMARGSATANNLARLLPLSHSRSELHFEKIWSDQAIKSRRLLNGGKSPRNPDGSAPAEVTLGTDNDVFLFNGAIRFPTANCCGILFAPALETNFPRPMSASPFDSGGLVHHFAQKVPTPSAKDFLDAHQLPVPDYRNYLSEFLASLFDPPAHYYLATHPPICEEPIVITGGDVRRATFEVRFQESLPLTAHVMAVFLSSIVAQEPWAKAIISECAKRGIAIRVFSTDNNLAYDHLVEATAAFIAEIEKGAAL